MGTLLIIKNADFSENGMPTSRVVDIVDGSLNVQKYFILTSSTIKVLCMPIIKVPAGKTITYMLGDASSYQGYKPGYSRGVYDKDITNLSKTEQEEAAILEECVIVLPETSGTLDNIIYTNSSASDIWITISIGFASNKQPENFDITVYKAAITGKVSYVIE